MLFQKTVIAFFLIFFCAHQAVSSGSVKLEWEHYFSNPVISDQLTDYVFLKGDYDLEFTKGPFDFKFQFKLEHSLDYRNWTYWDVPELFLFYKYDFEKFFYTIESIEFYLGRQIKVWSEGDKYWSLGLWNPAIRWNPLNPIISGNIGSFVTFKSNNWESDFFIGALHIPDSLTHLDIRDHRFYTYSRWRVIFPQKVDRSNLDIYYTSPIPFLFDLINQRSFFASFKTWSEKSDSNYWIKWSFADKPTNHFYWIMNKTGKLKFSSETKQKPWQIKTINNKISRLKSSSKKDSPAVFVDQIINVVLSRQRILSTEWGMDYKDFSVIFSLENTKIKEEKTLNKDRWSFINSRDSFTYFSLLLKYNYLDNSFIELGWIQSWFSKYNSYVNTAQIPRFFSQNKILEGLGLSWENRDALLKNLPLFFKLKYQYSFLDQGAWLSAKVSYYMSAKTYVECSVNILGSKRTDSKSFLDRFKHNDYFTWSFAHDF